MDGPVLSLALVRVVEGAWCLVITTRGGQKMTFGLTEKAIAGLQVTASWPGRFATAEEAVLADVLREKLRAVGAEDCHVDRGESGLLALVGIFMAGIERAADRRAFWEVLGAVADLALRRAGDQPKETP